MRRAHHVGMAEQRIGRRRLLDEHVEGRARDLPGIERLPQRLLVDQPAARTIDDAHALLHRRDRSGIDDVLGLVGQRRVQRDEVGALEQFRKIDLLDSKIARALGRQERIVGDHLHAQAVAAVGHDRADIAAADDAERLGGDLDPHEAVLLPFAGLRRSVGLRDLTRQREHQRDGVLGGGDRIAERRVHHDHALGGRRRNVDVVDADAGAADHPQLLGFLQKLRRHLGGGADGKAVEVADHLGELVLVGAELGLENGVDAAILEDLHGGVGKRIGNQNPGGHGIYPISWSVIVRGQCVAVGRLEPCAPC